MVSPKENNNVSNNAFDKSKWDEVVLKITSLPTHLVGECTEILASRNDIINCLKAMASSNEMEEANYESKIRQWEMDSEILAERVGKTTKLSEQDSQNVFKEVSQLKRQVNILASENTQMRKQLTTQGEHKLGIHKRAATAVSSVGNFAKEDTHNNNMRHIELQRANRARVGALERELKELQTAHAAQTENLFQATEREIQFENRVRTLHDDVSSAKQKIEEINEEIEKIQSSHLKSHREEEEFLCSLKERNAQSDISLKEQKAEATNISKDIAAIEHNVKNLYRKMKCILAMVKIKDAGLLSDADRGREPDDGIGPMVAFWVILFSMAAMCVMFMANHVSTVALWIDKVLK